MPVRSFEPSEECHPPVEGDGHITTLDFAAVSPPLKAYTVRVLVFGLHTPDWGYFGE